MAKDLPRCSRLFSISSEADIGESGAVVAAEREDEGLIGSLAAPTPPPPTPPAGGPEGDSGEETNRCI